MAEYDYLYQNFNGFIEAFGTGLDIESLQLRVDDFPFKSPQASSYVIQLPTRYLQLISLNSKLIFRNRNIFKNIGETELEDLNRENFILKETTLTIDFWKLISWTAGF
jgi:hypothetical protein